MPNTGKPSKDCHLCRSRRVKCDLARPQCQRCIKYGVACPGYRDEQELVFRNANPASLKKNKRQQHKAKHNVADFTVAPTALDVELTSLSSDSSTTLSPKTPSFLQNTYDHTLILDFESILSGWKEWKTDQEMPLPKSMTPHWTTESVPIILNIYPGLNLIQECYRKYNADGPLIWAAHLFSRTYVTNVRYPTSICRASYAESQQELGTYMGKALSAVSHALNEPHGTSRDDVLATIWVLANYELLVGSLHRDGPESSPWDMHCSGIYSILKARGTKQLLDHDGRVAFWPGYNLVQIHALVSTRQCPPESNEWLELIRKTVVPQEQLLLAIATFIHRSTSLTARIVQTIRSCNFQEAALNYYKWTAELAEAERLVEEDSALSDCSEPAELRMYMTNMRNSVLVKTHHIFTLLINFLTHWKDISIPRENLAKQRARSVKTCRDAGDAILASVPIVLGSLNPRVDKSPRVLFEAMKLIWPVTCVFITPSTLPNQKRRAEDVLHHMGNEVGIRQGLVRYSDTEPDPEDLWEPIGLPDTDAAESSGARVTEVT